MHKPPASLTIIQYNNKEKKERNSRVPRLSDTCYSAKGTKGKWRYASRKAKLNCATYRRKADLCDKGVKVGVSNFFGSIDMY